MSDPAPTVSARTIAMHIEHAGPAAWQTASSERQPGPSSPPAASRAARMVAWAREAYSHEAVRLLCEAARSCLAQVEEFAAQVDFSFGRPGSYEEHIDRGVFITSRFSSTGLDLKATLQQQSAGSPLDLADRCLSLAEEAGPDAASVQMYRGLWQRACGQFTDSVATLHRLARSRRSGSLELHVYRNLLTARCDAKEWSHFDEDLDWASRLDDSELPWAYYRLERSAHQHSIERFLHDKDRFSELVQGPEAEYWTRMIRQRLTLWGSLLGREPASIWKELSS